MLINDVSDPHRINVRLRLTGVRFGDRGNPEEAEYDRLKT